MANKYAGTKTEKNLWEAFAGESQARNKYTYFASVAKKQVTNKLLLYSSRLQKMKKSMLNYGSKLLVNLAQQKKIFFMLQKAKMLNGQICMNVWQKMLKKKAS